MKRYGCREIIDTRDFSSLSQHRAQCNATIGCVLVGRDLRVQILSIYIIFCDGSINVEDGYLYAGYKPRCKNEMGSRPCP